MHIRDESQVHTPPVPPTVRIGPRALVVFAGLPGAGKSTVLNGLRPTADVAVLDSESIHRRLGGLLGGHCPYRLYRGLVHLTHRARIVSACLFFRGPVVVHDPSTRRVSRALLVLLGVLSRRRRNLVWLHVAPAVALAGQRARGRTIGRKSFAGHVRRAARLYPALCSGGPSRGWQSVRALTREDIAGGVRLEVAGERNVGVST